MTLTAIDLIEALLRGGAAALILVLTAQLLVNRDLPSCRWYGIGFFITAAIYSITKIPMVHASLGPADLANQLVTMMAAPFFWLFIKCVVDDTVRWKSWMALPFVFVAVLVLVCVFFPALTPFSKAIQLTMVLVLMGDVVRVIHGSRKDDLVASRRKFSRALSYLVPMIALTILVIETLESLEIVTIASRMAIAMSMFAIAVVLVMTMSTLRKSLLMTSDHSRPETTTDKTMTAADRIDLGRLRDLMEEGAYLSAGMSIGELSGQMNVPEHRLRKLINNALGYRNFAAFLNDHRIAEAKRRLGQPEFVRDQITGLAFDLGYQSLAPFNRAFRERTGMSPTEYREKVLAGADGA